LNDKNKEDGRIFLYLAIHKLWRARKVFVPYLYSRGLFPYVN
jgi:hypothetical protein